MTKAEVIRLLREQGQRGTDPEVINYLLARLVRLDFDDAYTHREKRPPAEH